jgi:lipopolysaccharide export system protein LptA
MTLQSLKSIFSNPHKIVLFVLLLVVYRTGTAQVTIAGDTTNLLQILSHTRQLTLQTIDDSTQLTIVAGNVKLKQGNTLFFCDSCVKNDRTQVFEAWGNVRIVDGDTATVTSNHLRYLEDKQLAYLDGNVKLTDGKGTLTTPDLEYDMMTNIGIYKKGGRVVNGKTVLTSKEGWYYADLKDVYFKKDVVLKDPAYGIVTDSLLYNTESKTARFISFTTITDSSKRVIQTREGFYNQATGQAEFGQRPTILDPVKRITVTGDRISQNDSIYRVSGRGVFVDSAQGVTIIGDELYQNKLTEAVLATKKPLMIVKQDNDSIYITADTLFTAKLTALYGTQDSIVVDTVSGLKVAAIGEKDSTNRYFEAFRNVRIFNDSIQAVCDSMFYSFKDSVFRLYDNPIVWAQNSQITGDTIHLYTKNKKPEKIEAYDNSFMVNKMDTDAYNQIKSRRMDGYFVDGNIDSVRARGFAECIYYLRDDADSSYTGINETKSDIMDIYFEAKELDKVVFRSQVTGTIWPLSHKKPSEMRLEGFQWLEARRPKTKYEMFE